MGTPKLQERSVRIPRTLSCGLGWFLLLSSCTTLPEPTFTPYDFPADEAFLEAAPPRVGYRIEKLSVVKSKINFTSLDPNRDEETLCKNAYNQGAQALVKKAKAMGGHAVEGLRSVVFYFDGKSELMLTPECSDEGGEGQILVQGQAIRYLKEKPTEPSHP